MPLRHNLEPILIFASGWSLVLHFLGWQLYPIETAPNAHLIGHWVGLRPTLDAVGE